jgi:hypothetical protein
MALPIPVAMPAKSVSPKAIQREPVCMMIYLKGIELQNARRESVVLAFDLKKRVRECNDEGFTDWGGSRLGREKP